ncbi:MAG: right-handed parallel beta-helix repeat-containing protein [Planctomycetota bacterium]
MEKTIFEFTMLADRLGCQQIGLRADKGRETGGWVTQHRKSDTMRRIVPIFIFFMAVLPCRARIINVDDDELADFSIIQAAIDDADPGDTIVIGPGIYRGMGNRDIDFHGKAITVCSTNPSDPMIVSATVIDCEGSPTEYHRAFIFQNNEDEYSIIDGLTLIGGYADQGGAIDCKPGCSPVIKNCVIRGNVAAEIDGGGINCITSTAKILNCLIEDNTAFGYGGGVNSCEGADITISNCIIRNNSSGDDGGGYQSCRGHATVTGCLFEGNISGGEGGGIWSLRPIDIDHCTIVGNRASFRGGGMTGNWDPCVITNSIIRDNLSGRGDPFNDIFLRSPDSEVSYSNYVPLGAYPGIGNIDADPCFAEPGQWVPDPANAGQTIWSGGDFHLKSQAGRWVATTQNWVTDDATSPCIDAGDPMSPIAFEPFPNGGRVNMGAYGASDEASKAYFGSSPCQTIIAGDINGDCVVDFEDLVILVSHWTMQGTTFQINR